MPVSPSIAGRGLAAYFRPPLTIDAVWLAAAPFVLVVGVLVTPIRPFDYFWSLVQGRAIVQLGHIPTQNLFLHTMPADAPFFDQPWLAQLTMLAAFRVGGHTANLLLLAGLLFLAMVVTIDTALRAGGMPRFVGIVALAMAPLLTLGAGARTQMFAYPCFALVLRAVVLRPPDRTLRALLPYAAVVALWSNLHGSFLLAPLLFALGGVAALTAEPQREGGRRASLRQGLRELGVVLAATLVNPRGPLLYAYAAELGSAMRAAGHPAVTEWQPPSLHEATGVLFYGLAALGLGCAILRRRRLVLPALLPYLLFAILSFVSLRFLPWWALSSVVAFARAGGVASAEPRRRGPAWPNLALLAVLASVAGLSLPGAPIFERTVLRPRLPYAEARALGVETPLRAAEQLASGYPGKLFHTQAVGGLVEWTLTGDGPRPVAFVDQRFELTPPSVWQDYFAICEARADWPTLLDRYGIGTLLLDEAEAGRLLAALGRAAGWRLVKREFAYHLYERAAVVPK